MMSTAAAPHLPPQSQAEPQIADDWPTLDELSLRYLHRVMDRTKGNKTKAAEILGIDRRTVIRILAKVRKGKTQALQTNGGA
jgi:transcriptional regulator with PAS, ATPase and Fis domain